MHTKVSIATMLTFFRLHSKALAASSPASYKAHVSEYLYTIHYLLCVACRTYATARTKSSMSVWRMAPLYSAAAGW